MHAKFISYLRPTPATAIAMVALVFAMTANAGAGPRTLVNLSGGPVTTTSPNTDVTIPLNGQATYSFTQKAGEAVQVIATFDADAGTGPSGASFCNLLLMVYGDKIQARYDVKSEAGELGEGSAVGGRAAPATDTTVTLRAIARELSDPTESQCDQANSEEPSTDPVDQDTWTVSVRVTVHTIRS